ncbi:hypothetical protein UlMin_024011 [Ulmus minor]
MDSATTLYNQLKAAEPFFLLAGPNLIESEEHIMWMAKSIKTIASKVGLPLVFQSSFDKANRTSSKSFRGPGMSEGLKILEKVKIACDIPIVTDVHESIQCEEVGKVADIIQIPSFLCCQTDLLVATAKTGKIINIKKGQFCAPSVMVNSVEKVRLAGNPNVMVCEREQYLDTTDAVDPKINHSLKILSCCSVVTFSVRPKNQGEFVDPCTFRFLEFFLQFSSLFLMESFRFFMCSTAFKLFINISYLKTSIVFAICCFNILLTNCW